MYDEVDYSAGVIPMEITDYEPKLVWKHFNEIRQIPHGSKNETKIREYIKSFAQKNGCKTTIDQAGNLVVHVAATAGMEKKPMVILQGHMDMVCEKNSDTKHDWDNDALKLKINGEYLNAVGTTLGADNGIGLCAALALIEDKTAKHGPLEMLFTVDEETGLTGAFALKDDLLTGRTLINLDTEEWGAIYVGCAGGAETKITMPLETEAIPKNYGPVKLKLTGLHGGHSGVDIHLQRANAIKCLARTIWAANRLMELRLVSIMGGNKHNAIPREAEAVVVVKKSDKARLKDIVKKQEVAMKGEFVKVDPELKITVEDSDVKDMLAVPKSIAVIALLNALPHGVLVKSYDIPDLIETSVNLAIVNTEGGKLEVTMSSRSSVGSSLEATRNLLAAISELAGAKVDEPPGYPGWKPNLDSNVLKLAQKKHKDLFNKEPGIKAIHAGLETGIIGEKFMGMDMISIGPQIEFPHSPDERVKIDTVDHFYKFLKAILQSI